MKYGYFDQDAREYVITNPRTPTKWINYVGTLSFGGFVDHTGGALLCRNDPAKNRITKYIQQSPQHAFRGTTLYARVREGDGFCVFSPFFVPSLTEYDRFECHIGLGYTRIVSEFFEVRTEVTIFVPQGEAREIRDIRVTNLAKQARAIDIVPLVEYTHPNAIMQFTNADWVPQTMTSRAVQEGNEPVVLLQYPFMHRDTQVNFFTANRRVSSFETDRRHFLGDNEYGTWACPKALSQDELDSYEAHRGDIIAALLIPMGALGPGETGRAVVQLGQDASIDAAREGIARFRREEEIDSAFAQLRRFWDSYLSHVQATTPDASMNAMVNVHNQHQCHVTKNWSRYLSFYQLGMGLRGLGFRDSAQDVLGVLHADAGEAEKLIRLLLSIQRPDGSAYHSVNPLTREVSIGEAGEYTGEDVCYYGDDHLWIVLAVCEYVKETGAYGFLDERVSFRDGAGRNKDGPQATVQEHMVRALEFTRTHTGAHGLPLLGYADWNDSVNLAAGAESVFIANLYGRALVEMIALCTHRGDRKAAAKYQAHHDEMKKRINEHAWDGNWYVRYFDRDGNPLGSHASAAGQIYANAQSWSVLSGFAWHERARAALDSVRDKLNTRHGIKIATPGYNGFDPAVGGVSTYPPGAKENCGIFLHTNPWVMIAETMLGHGDRAFEYYRQINPAAKNEHIDEYEIEPYVYAQNILADEHPQFGLGRNSWLSGTASWAFQAAVKYILGIRPEHEGLRIDPCIPAAWEGFTAVRRFRNAQYNIEVRNPRHVSKGVRSVTVDGSVLRDNLVPLFEDHAEHRVVVDMGTQAGAAGAAVPEEESVPHA
ncbi:MAG: glycosyl transferase [Chitinivibrionales bacterium]|nr:glycosyl transferase [Chitinivibrionales bacterium]MBD3394865.1 glycosyl transferase [Chitinivibrionales bacterium]